MVKQLPSYQKSKKSVVNNDDIANIVDRNFSVIQVPFRKHRMFSKRDLYKMEFASFEELELLWFDYVNWYNNERIHGSLNYLTPHQYSVQ